MIVGVRRAVCRVERRVGSRGVVSGGRGMRIGGGGVVVGGIFVVDYWCGVENGVEGKGCLGEGETR